MDVRTQVIRVLAGGLLAAGIGGVTLAGTATASNAVTNVNEPMWHIGLNQSSCNYNPTTLGPTAKNGQAVFHVDKNAGTTTLDVSISSAVASTSYDVDIRCTAPYPIGTINTDAYGNGSAEIVLPQTLATYVATHWFYVDAAVDPSTPPCPCGGAGFYGDTFISTQFGPLGS